MRTLQRYPTAPLQSMQRIKELKRLYGRLCSQAHSQGAIVIMMVGQFSTLVSGLGDYVWRLYAPRWTEAIRKPELLIKYHETAEAHGLGQDICSPMRHYLGQILSGLGTQNPDTGEHDPVDFIFQITTCESMAKTAQFAGEYMGVPCIALEAPFYGDRDNRREYLVAQMEEAIPRMEQITGREFNDEWFIAGVKNEWKAACLIGKICELNKAIPAPLDYQQLHATTNLIRIWPYKRETVEAFEMLYDEVQDRVKRGISARGMETARLAFFGEAPYYCEDEFFDLPQRYGAVVMSGYQAFGRGAWERLDDGTWLPCRDLDERGWELKTRADALNALAEMHLDYRITCRLGNLELKPEEIVKMCQDWHVDGALLHLDVSCRNHSLGFLEAKIELERAGVPALGIEGANNDPRLFSFPRYVELMDAFCERLGLRRIESEGEGGQAK